MGSIVSAGLCFVAGLTERHPGRLIWVFAGPVDLTQVGSGASADRTGPFCERALDIFSGTCGGGGGGGSGGGGGPGRGGFLRMTEYVCMDTTLEFGNKPIRVELPAWAIFRFHHHELSKVSVK